MSDASYNATSGSPGRQPVLMPGQTFGSVTDHISGIVLSHRTPKIWWALFFPSLALVGLLGVTIVHLLTTGIGVWGTNMPVAWAFPIVNFVWWIGIGHAGTLISAVLLLLKQSWRTSINRFAEAMTLFAVACAGLFPLLHMGRPWVFYWMLPYPNTMGIWPQFRSPLVWDVFAVSTYATVSALFWYVGLIPDMATLRDRSTKRIPQIIYGIMAMGWRNSAVHWHRYHVAYVLLAGIATPLVVSVHSIVGMDFAASILPGWHSTIFPPYFVAGAVYSGFAMVMTLAIPLRAVYGLQDFVTAKHLDAMAKIMLATSLIVSYGYLAEAFFAYYSSNDYERYVIINRAFGPYAWSYWCLLACNLVAPQFFWLRSVRRSVVALFILSLVTQFGMWLERFVIVVTSLSRDYLPSAWHMYYPTFWDYSMFFGTMGLFMTLFLLFIRYLPMISIFELRELVHVTDEERAGGRT